MMSGIASILGIGSSQAEISDDEASDVSVSGEEIAAPLPARTKEEKKGKDKAKSKVVEEKEESLMVESEKDEDEEDDDEEVGPDECVAYKRRTKVC
jgi:chromobox protein 1